MIEPAGVMPMLTTVEPDRLAEVACGSHVAWLVSDADDYRQVAASFIAKATAEREKVLVFGPEDSEARAHLGALASASVDPRLAFLGGSGLDPAAMFAVFRAETEIARAEGFTGLRVIADMDWLMPVPPTSEQLTAFELLLDRVVLELRATVVCAYRRGTFTPEMALGALAVHPVLSGCEEPPFRMVAGNPDTWWLSGEVDCAAGTSFGAAIDAAAASGACVIDVSGLRFIDVAGLRALAQACRRADGAVRFRGSSPSLRRLWDVCGYNEIVPLALDEAPPSTN